LVGGRSNIYVKGKLFNQCKYLLLNIPTQALRKFETIDSIDQAAETLSRSMEGGGRSRVNLAYLLWINPSIKSKPNLRASIGRFIHRLRSTLLTLMILFGTAIVELERIKDFAIISG